VCVDLRGSTHWANSVVEKDFGYVKIFMDKFIQWVLQNARASTLGSPNYAKFLGDGILLIWEIPETKIVDGINSGVKFGCSLRKQYPRWVKKNARKFTWGVPIGIGVGVDVGTAIRLTFENGSNDYIGVPISFASKMQHYARPKGGVVVQERLYPHLNGKRSDFTRQGVMKIGDCEVNIRITKDV